MKIDGYDVAWPIRTDGSLGNWGVGYETLRTLINKGYVSLGKYDAKRKTWGISYISLPNQKMIDDGRIRIVDRDPKTGVVSIEYTDGNNRAIKTVWHRSLHDAGAYGSDLVSSIIGQSRAFSFPKSLYSTKDAIMAVVRNNKNALIVDFFASTLNKTAQEILDFTMELCFATIAAFVTWRLMAGGISAYHNDSETMFLQLPEWPVYLFGSIACVFWVITILFTAGEALMRCMGMETETVAAMTDFS